MEQKIKSIEIALENESKERDFYLKQAERSADPLGKKMFATIATEEEEHYRYLKELHAKLSEKGEWPEEISVVIHDTNVKKVLDELVDTVTYSNAATADDKEAIEIAIAFEKSSFDYYTDLAEKADGEDEKMVFSLLASMEREHFTSLEQTLMYYEDPAQYFAMIEKPNFDA